MKRIKQNIQLFGICLGCGVMFAAYWHISIIMDQFWKRLYVNIMSDIESCFETKKDKKEGKIQGYENSEESQAES